MAARIGITTYREQAEFGVWSEPADLLPTSYADVVAAAGGVPLLLPPAGAPAADTLDALDGLVLGGGADVDPARYGAPRDPRTGPPRPDRDGWELALVDGALRRGLPVLGVCRGMQVLAVALGGSLLQHLPDRVGGDAHCPTVGRHGRHGVRLAAGSRLGDLLGERAEVATYHHQAVDVLPATAVPTGWADDGTVEAFELTGSPWAVGVQWHPEVHDGARLFAGFVAACGAAAR